MMLIKKYELSCDVPGCRAKLEEPAEGRDVERFLEHADQTLGWWVHIMDEGDACPEHRRLLDFDGGQHAEPGPSGNT
jgi:hypothetical protein